MCGTRSPVVRRTRHVQAHVHATQRLHNAQAYNIITSGVPQGRASLTCLVSYHSASSSSDILLSDILPSVRSLRAFLPIQTLIVIRVSSRPSQTRRNGPRPDAHQSYEYRRRRPFLRVIVVIENVIINFFFCPIKRGRTALRTRVVVQSVRTVRPTRHNIHLYDNI